MLSPIIIALGWSGLAGVVESIGLYYLKLGGLKHLIYAALIYGIGVTGLLKMALNFEGVGMVNFFWNFFTTIIAFWIGIYLFKEKVHYLQLIGVMLSTLGLGLIILAPEENKN
jgi:drug/metabolite transporter (DMT)-like permease